MIKFICDWDGIIVLGKNRCISRRFLTTFDEFMDKFYHVTSYDKQYTRSTLTCWYPLPQEHIALRITYQETMEIVFELVLALRNCLGIYIEGSVENPQQIPLTVARTGRPLFWRNHSTLNVFLSATLHVRPRTTIPLVKVLNTTRVTFQNHPPWHLGVK